MTWWCEAARSDRLGTAAPGLPAKTSRREGDSEGDISTILSRIARGRRHGSGVEERLNVVEPDAEVRRGGIVTLA